MSRIDNISQKHQAVNLPNIQTKITTDQIKQKPDSPGSTGSKYKNFHSELQAMIDSESKKQQINPELVKAIIQTESNGNQNAKSHAGAIGLMQLMPGTAKSLGVNPYDPVQNIQGGVKFLKQMASRYGSLDKTLAAYNAGPGAVNKYGGVPPYKETQNYIKKIRNLINQ